MKPNYTHENVLTTDMFWKDGVLYWRIYLTDGHVCGVSDEEMRKWLKANGELNSRKISYRKMAKYAISNRKIDK